MFTFFRPPTNLVGGSLSVIANSLPQIRAAQRASQERAIQVSNRSCAQAGIATRSEVDRYIDELELRERLLNL
jgi:hypothetical protein